MTWMGNFIPLFYEDIIIYPCSNANRGGGNMRLWRKPASGIIASIQIHTLLDMQNMAAMHLQEG